MHAFWLFLFAIAVGFTASGLVASLYRVCGFNAKTESGRLFRMAVLAVAGPSVLFEAALEGRRRNDWRPISFWLVTAAVSYWSLALGVLVLEVALAL